MLKNRIIENQKPKHYYNIHVNNTSCIFHGFKLIRFHIAFLTASIKIEELDGEEMKDEECSEEGEECLHDDSTENLDVSIE